MSFPKNHIELRRMGRDNEPGGVFIDGVQVFVLEDGISIELSDDQPVVTLTILPETLICRGQ